MADPIKRENEKQQAMIEKQRKAQLKQAEKMRPQIDEQFNAIENKVKEANKLFISDPERAIILLDEAARELIAFEANFKKLPSSQIAGYMARIYNDAMENTLLRDIQNQREFVIQLNSGIETKEEVKDASNINIIKKESELENEASERLSDASSDISELESSASSRKSSTPPPLQSADTRYKLMPDVTSLQSVDDKKEEVDVLKNQSSRVQPNIPQPEASKPEASKPNLLIKLFNGIRDLFKGGHSQKNSGGSMGKIFQRMKPEDLSFDEMKANIEANIEANKQAKWVETKPSIDKGPLTASKIEKQLPSANWFKDDEKQEDTRPTLGGHRRP